MHSLANLRAIAPSIDKLTSQFSSHYMVCLERVTVNKEWVLPERKGQPPRNYAPTLVGSVKNVTL